MRTTTPALSRAGHVLQELQRLRRAPAQRVVDLARIDHGLQPGACLGRALHRHQQRQQALAVARAGVLLQRLAERQMLRLAFGRKPRRVGRQERERRLLVLAVLGEIEVHAADQVPGRMAALEELLHGEPGLGQLGIEGRVDARHRSASTAAVRYSAPVIGGAAAAIRSSAPSPAAGTLGLVRASPIPGRAQSAVT